jgi:RNA polymerase sigma-70 factor (ECF subfamily)
MQISLSYSQLHLVSKRSAAEVDLLLRDARPWLYRLALAIALRPDVAEDIVQESLIRASRSREKLRSVQEPNAWLRPIVVRCAITALKSTAPVTPVKEGFFEDPTESLAVRDTLSRLTGTDRAVLAMAHFEDLSYAEIAEILNVPEGTVASRLHHAREAFRKEWQK